MNEKPGTTVETAGIYWCTVCKSPVRFQQGETFPTCQNLCGRGNWQLVEAEKDKNPSA